MHQGWGRDGQLGCKRGKVEQQGAGCRMVRGMYGPLYIFPSCQHHISNDGNATGTARAGAGAGRLRRNLMIMTVVGALHKLQQHVS